MPQDNTYTAQSILGPHDLWGLSNCGACQSVGPVKQDGCNDRPQHHARQPGGHWEAVLKGSTHTTDSCFSCKDRHADIGLQQRQVIWIMKLNPRDKGLAGVSECKITTADEEDSKRYGGGASFD
mmetsp:Transcript_15767/g.37625  ORF Transcript_15767/g.37625 Transcript_15767/m.37625 type:complete len:124 (+) Transcript_15767:258-629(+)